MNYSKQRLRTFNRVLNNGTNQAQAKRFIDIAAEVLPMELFQKIYGLTIMNEENSNQTIDDIKQFVNECKMKGEL